MRRAVLAVALLASPAASGCGERDVVTDEDRVTTAVQAFGKAVQEHDYRKVCDELLADALLKQLAGVGLPCTTALERGLGGVRAPKLSVDKVTVDHDRATATVRSSAAGQRPSVDQIRLVRERGGWRIASLIE